MPEYVKKGIMANHYPKVPGGYSDPECSHVIFTIDEYKAVKNKVKNAEDEARIAESNSEAAIKKMKRESDSHIQAAKETAQKSVEAAELKLAKAQKEIEYQIGLNENLLRISRERANADRNLKPKKEHTGYIIISSTEKDYIYKKGHTNIKRRAWETILQSPYVFDFDEQQARRQVYDEIMSITAKIGIENYYDEKLSALFENGNNLQKNQMFDIRLKRNFVSKYWEVIFNHTLPIGRVPKDMIKY